jgi:hypothetical protein
MRADNPSRSTAAQIHPGRDAAPLKVKDHFLSICARASSGPRGWQNGIPAAILGCKMESAFRFDRYRRSLLSTSTGGAGKTSWTQALFPNARRIDPLAPTTLRNLSVCVPFRRIALRRHLPSGPPLRHDLFTR